MLRSNTAHSIYTQTSRPRRHPLTESPMHKKKEKTFKSSLLRCVKYKYAHTLRLGLERRQQSRADRRDLR